MDREMVLRHLAEAERHAAIGKRIIARQKQLIEELKRDGHNAAEAQDALARFEDLQRMNLADLDRLRHDAREAATLNRPQANQTDKKARALDDAKNWRDKAAYTRALAESLADPESKRLMLEIAGKYDRLVKHAEERDKRK